MLVAQVAWRALASSEDLRALEMRILARIAQQAPRGSDEESVDRVMFEEFGIKESFEDRVMSLVSQAESKLQDLCELEGHILTQLARAKTSEVTGQHLEAALHGFRAELEPFLAQQSAAMSALALRQAAQEDVAAAQLERCAALEEAQHVDLDCHRQT